MKEKNSMPSFPIKMPSFISEKKKEKEKEKTLLEGVDVIDWDEAMQQCGDDEEFLRELLGDLREETDGQMAQMEKIVEDPSGQPFIAFVRAAHVIKGAASNLMCEQLRVTSMALETRAQTAVSDMAVEDSKTSSVDKKTKHLELVLKELEGLKLAVKKYHDYLVEVGV